MGKLTLFQLIRDQLSHQKPVVRVDLTGKTVMLVGANTGLGFEACKHFATMNPGRLILACRSQQRGQAALDKLKQETDCKTAELVIVDLANFDSVTALADKFEAEGARLDILVMNAAVASFSGKFEAAGSNGYESTVQVNHLGTSLLALRLLPRLLDTAEKFKITPRIVVVSSDLHYVNNLPKDLLDKDNMIETLASEKYSTSLRMRIRYNVSKLLNVFFVQGLNAHLPPSSPLIVDAVNPGYCYSELRRNVKGFFAFLDWLMEKALALTTEEGSRQLVWAALGGEGREDELKGGYVSSSDLKEASDFTLGAEGEKIRETLWSETVRILSKADPKVQEVVQQRCTNNGKSFSV